MSICIYGAGAIGCWLAARLQRAGFEPNLVARGAHLQALQRNGLQITEAGKTESLKVHAFGEQDELSAQDVIIVTLKAYSISYALDHLKGLMHAGTHLLFAVNGIPWWFFHGLPGINSEQPVQSVDLNGRIWREVGPERAIGCVIYPAAEIVAPGVVKHISGERLSIGEPTGGTSVRTEELAETLSTGGCRVSIRRDIRNEIWLKLWGNVAFNPMSVLTGATLDHLATDPGTQLIATRLMQETQTIGINYGARFGMTIARRVQGAASVGPHKTSMLQDYLQGKPLETNAMLDAVLELAELAAVDVPTIRMIQALLQMKLASE